MTQAPPQRLRWRCRRGTLELDWLLVGFMEAHWDQLTDPERDAFERLLGCEDDELMDWLVNGRTEPDDARLQAITQRIRRDTGL